MKQRLSLAKSLINDPQVLFLDEPTVGLDPDVSIRIREEILSIHKERGMTVLLTTHNMKEAEYSLRSYRFSERRRDPDHRNCRSLKADGSDRRFDKDRI